MPSRTQSIVIRRALGFVIRHLNFVIDSSFEFRHSSFFLLAVFSSAAMAKNITVAPDGTGNFKTIQDAIASIPEHNTDGTNGTVIHIKPGTYQGPITVPADKRDITFDGEGETKTILTFNLNQQDPISAGVNPRYRGTGVVILGNDFHASNLTFQNTSGDHGQALALRIDGDRATIDHCKLIGWQDTLMLNNGRQYFHDCDIAGRVDFIYGSATAVFDHCDIHSRNGGHVTAASTPADHPFGFVFLDCRLTGDAIPWNPATTDPAPTDPAKLQKVRVTPIADLGRPWRPFAAVAFIRCQLGDHIAPRGWNNWRNPANEKTARYCEYKNTGPGANPAARVPWSHQLSDAEAAKITIANVLGGNDHWNPELP
jgi:pectinesterase